MARNVRSFTLHDGTTFEVGGSVTVGGEEVVIAYIRRIGIVRPRYRVFLVGGGLYPDQSANSVDEEKTKFV